MNLLAVIVSLVVIGTHTENGTTSPLYAVRIGDTTHAEALSEKWARYFGPNAINGIVYTPNEDSTWRKTTFSRPADVEQAQDFIENPEGFTRSETTSEVPESLERSVKDIDYVVVYFDGGAKVYLKANTPQREADAIASAIAKSMEMSGGK